jgi:hypothetical protein
MINFLENFFKTQFQKNIEITIGGTQVIKKGKFILVRPNLFTLDLYIKSNKPTAEIISLPIPFHYTTNNDLIVFDYDISKIAVKNTKGYKNLSLYIGKYKTSKFLNNQLHIKFE